MKQKLINIFIYTCVIWPNAVLAQGFGTPDTVDPNASTTDIYRGIMSSNPSRYNPGDIMMTYVIGWVYKITIPLATAAAILSIIIAGFQLMMSQGNSDSAGNATQRLMGSILGLVLIILTAVILHEVNPYVFTF